MKLTIKDYILNFVGAVLPECGVAYLLIKLFDKGWDTFGVIFIAIQGLYFTVWLFRAIVSKMMFEILNKSKIAEHFYTSLVQNKFPDPFNIYHGDVESYLEEVICDQTLMAEVRMSATSMLTSLRTYKESGQFQIFLKKRKCVKIAVEKYQYVNFDHRRDLETADSNASKGRLDVALGCVAILSFFAIAGAILYKVSANAFGWNFWDFLSACVLIIVIIGWLLDGFEKVKKLWPQFVYPFASNSKMLRNIPNEEQMKIRFECQKCGTKYSAKPNQTGRMGICRKCGTQIIVPS